jgi:hypothetical protein
MVRFSGQPGGSKESGEIGFESELKLYYSCCGVGENEGTGEIGNGMSNR